MKFAEKAQVTSYRPEDQAALVKNARRGLEGALGTKKAARELAAIQADRGEGVERPLTAYAATEEAAEVPRRSRQRPGKKQRDAYRRRLAEAEAVAQPRPRPAKRPPDRLLPQSSKAPPTPRPPARLRPESKVQPGPRPPPYLPPPPPWKKKGKSKGKQKGGKGKTGAGRRQGAAGGAPQQQRPAPVQDR